MAVLLVSTNSRFKEEIPLLFNEMGIKFSLIEDEDEVFWRLRHASVPLVVLDKSFKCLSLYFWFKEHFLYPVPVMFVDYTEETTELVFLKEFAEFVRKNIHNDAGALYHYLSSVQALLKKRNKILPQDQVDKKIRQLMWLNRKGYNGLRNLNTRLKNRYR